MLPLKVSDVETYDEKTNEFRTIKGGILYLEHSLLSISKWESETHEPFLKKEHRSYEETLLYIKCMTVSNTGGADIFDALSKKNIDEVNAYISDPMSATTFSNNSQKEQRVKTRKSYYTSEQIYHLMIALQIPFECQKWHINRLLALIKICEIENERANKKGRMSRSEIYNQNHDLNEARKKALNTKG